MKAAILAAALLTGLAPGAAPAGDLAGDPAPAIAPPPTPRVEARDAAPAQGEAIAVTARPASLTLPATTGVRVTGALSLSADHPRFGGFSGLALDPDGAGFTAVSDRGAFLTGRLTREGSALSGLRDARLFAMRDRRGQSVRGEQVDAEGLARAPDGALFVAFEGDARIWRFEGPGARAEAAPTSPAFGRLQRNSGLEALAIATGGALLAIPERSGALERPFPVFRLEAGARVWTEGALPRDPPFLVTGADVGPDGMLYILERDFSWLGGFSTRLRRAALTDWPDLRPETLFTLSGGIDNMEGLASWRDADGAVRLLMIGDDNFSPLQRTLLVELLVE